MESLTFLISGLVLGFSAAISPGPMTMLVISQTVRHGLREDIKVALIPIFTDGPIIWYKFVVRTLGVILLFFAGQFIYEAIKLFSS